MSARSAFDELLFDTLIPAFCSDASRRMAIGGFVTKSNIVTETDAADFLRAWHAGLPVHQGRGQYLVGAGRVKEQFFNSGLKAETERTFHLANESIITMAAIARLHFDHGWPIDCLAAQSADWAYDIAVNVAGRAIIAGEVKKTRKEIDDLIQLMKQYGANPAADAPASGKTRNAFKKVASLRKSGSPMVWLVGPDNYDHVFEVAYGENGIMEFNPTTRCALAYEI